MEMHMFYLLWIVMMPNFTVTTAAKANLALYGKATQSDLIDNPWAAFGHASNAIDGNHDPYYLHGSCTATKLQTNPWWRVDLLDEYIVTSITITNRVDCCPEGINGAEIRIGNSLLNNGNSNPLAEIISSIPAGVSSTFRWKKGFPGRYVNVVIPGTNKALTLCEVEVFGHPAPNDKNLALYGRATQSDLVENPWAAEGQAINAIDGNRDPYYLHGSCTATVIQTNPWWRVDLLDEYIVTSITITNRVDCCPERINGAEIHIGNSLLNNGNSNPLAERILSIPAGESSTFRWKKGFPGRYVNVVIPGNKQVLTLCEVEVFGYLAPYE